MPITRIVVMRGLSGSGKSTRARQIAQERNGAVVSIDHYFENLGRFEPSRIPDAILAMQRNAQAIEKLGKTDTLIVDNTHSMHHEYDWARGMANRLGAILEVVTLDPSTATDAELERRNVHGVPQSAIARMRARWEA